MCFLRIPDGPRSWTQLRHDICSRRKNGEGKKGAGLPDRTGGCQAVGRAVRVERGINGCDAEHRRALRQEQSRPLLNDMHACRLASAKPSIRVPSKSNVPAP